MKKHLGIKKGEIVGDIMVGVEQTADLMETWAGILRKIAKQQRDRQRDWAEDKKKWDLGRNNINDNPP